MTPDIVKAELLRRNFHSFFKHFWPVIASDELVDSWHIGFICDELQRYGERLKLGLPHEGDLLVNVPPGSSKSTIISVAFPAWLWTIYPEARVISASYSATISVDLASKARDIIQSDDYKRMFPYVVIRDDSNNKTKYVNTKGGFRFATSVTGSVTGLHGSCVICDDLLSPKESASEISRNLANDFLNVTLPTRKVNKDIVPTILVMQRLAQNDPAGVWLEQAKYSGKKLKHICLPAELSDNVHPPELREKYVDGLLDPIRMSRDTLKSLRATLGSYAYGGQMQQNPMPDDGGIWNEKWFNVVPDHLFPEDSELRKLAVDWDLAYTKNERNSASAYVKAGLLGKKMYISEIGWKFYEMPELIGYMKRFLLNGIHLPHYVELKASGHSVQQVLVSSGIPAFGAPNVGKDKISRATLMSPYAESGLIYVKQSIFDKLMFDEKQGIAMFPNNTHDDLNDALCQAIQRLLGKKPFFVI